ncbi:hypothetical protein [Stigmatella aurantiaca]|uniref:Conserved uncharacterized protein n=1 Tax=Stigmatella aurantiaca (strain DW4/3-1) TaxID=378806 RepID=Q096C6_STIAD|nr:hypothetical protein [Stigmatella aurantiaca]ADO69498.1 conserved uncharacterized protein [Stigmatella aurantiaca DW4/3-1]EAU67581.1 hypothetical protein STIAU_3795 [Stigmatella aurantiaca DW4/3-1]
MLSFLLATTLAAAPAPRAVPGADPIVHIPRLDALQGLYGFMTRAGMQSVMMRPANWNAELHPFFTVDPLHPETLTSVGIDPAGATTVSFIRRGKVSCTRLADPKRFQARAEETLKAEGEPKTATAQGMTTVIAPRGPGRAGYVLKGQEACAFASLYDDEDLLKATVKLMGKAPVPDARLGKLPGGVFLLQGAHVVGLDGTSNGLQAEGTASKLPLPPFKAAASSPYGEMKPGGLLFARAQVAPAGLSPAVGSVRGSIQQLCTACPPDSVEAMTKAITPQLTGQVLMHVDSVKVNASLRTPEGRFFAPRQALAAEVKDAAAVKAALAPLAKFPGAQALADGYALTLKGGTLFIRQKGQQLVLGNDEAVVQNLLAALPVRGAKLPRTVDFTVDPKRVAAALSQVSLMDIVSDQQLAALFAMSSELGPLLASSERITGWLDSAPGNTHRFSITWTLPTLSESPLSP